MQSVHIGEHAPPGDFRMMPLIYLNPGDKSCILSTLKFILSKAERLKIEIAYVTFDQCIYPKAVEIVKAHNMSNIVIRLGSFHMIMSYLGSIGAVMAESGLAEALQCCYGSNTVIHMMTGKAVSRAIHGFFLVESALSIILLKSLLEPIHDDPCIDHGLNKDNIDQLRLTYDHLVVDESTMVFADAPECLKKLDKIFQDYKTSLALKSRTGKLWIQYLGYIQILKDFIRAERTGNWNLHLISVCNMLNLFAATGHNNYAKSGRLYLQMMLELPLTHPWLYDKFVNHGFHAVRRSDRYWAALSTDLIIEQVMMKAIKGRGGLTHGRGMNDSVCLLWVRSLHKCAGVRNALSHLTDMEVTDNQHVDLGKSRVDRDFKDLVSILDWFNGHNPFNTSDSRLRCIASSLVASDSHSVNCDKAEEIGALIMAKMDKLAVSDVVLKKADQIKTLASLDKKVKVSRKAAIADNSLLFNRLLVIMSRLKTTDLEKYFQYELTTVPTALFTDHGMRKTNNAALTKELRKNLGKSPMLNELPRMHVIDGGCLLHRVGWTETGTYAESCIIVFDGYNSGPTVKDQEHVRRAKNCSPVIDVTESNPVYRNQSAFPMNANNKQSFVLLLSNHFRQQRYEVRHAESDVDTVIVGCAIQLARQLIPVTVIADDADVLVLLV